ncbi:FAD-dependent oxidoreductase [Clavibacter zhangzhiyongii]|uniref:FAD-dependent oxidoreductase n=1 Tax=Clavibacter zhangzhiyongii TaxID=2768071 RepID=UPI0039E03DF0
MTPTPADPPRAAADRLAGLPVAVIGAGPVGLAAAAHLRERGLPVVVLEAGSDAGAAVRTWAHVRMFSPWSAVVDDAAARLLAPTDWVLPAGAAPTGAELVARYLVPLAATPELAAVIRYGARVEAVSREGMDRSRSAGRADAPFLLRVRTPAGVEHVRARAVVDASGTTGTPNPLTAAGLDPTTDLGDRIVGAFPDVRGRDRARFAGRRVLVVGAGHSAATAVIALARLAEEAAGTTVAWLVRTPRAARLAPDAADELVGRGQLGTRVHRLVAEGRVEHLTGVEIDDVQVDGDGVRVAGRRGGERFATTADVVVQATGSRPDLAMLREVRLALDDVVEAPRALAPLIDPQLHSCGSVPPHGAAELAHPEPGLFVAGMKSYGRAPTFLLLTGYEQVRSIAAELAGDRAAAREVRLVLPSTGVCSTDVPDDDVDAVPSPRGRDLLAVGAPAATSGAPAATSGASSGGCCA